MSTIPEQSEKRGYPRVRLLRSLKLVHESGTAVKANLRDISPGGVQAMCDRESVQGFVPTESYDPANGALVFASFNLPVGGKLLGVEVDCRMIHLSLVEEEGVAIGLRFVSFRGESLDNLRQFIVEAIEPGY